MREIRTLRVMWRDLGTELWDGLRHQCLAKAAGNSYSPDLQPPHQIPTLPADYTKTLGSLPRQSSMEQKKSPPGFMIRTGILVSVRKRCCVTGRSESDRLRNRACRQPCRDRRSGKAAADRRRPGRPT